MNNTAQWVLLAVAISCLLYVIGSIRGWRKIATLRNFLLHDGTLDPPGFWGTMVATNAAVANGFFLYLVLGYHKGWGAFVWSALFWILGLLVFQLCSKKLGVQFASLTTLNEFLGKSSGSNSNKVRIVAATATTVSFVLTLSMELIVGSQIFFALLGTSRTIEPIHGIVVAMLLVIPVAFYLTLGGFPAVVQSDFLQVICFIPGLYVCAKLVFPTGLAAAKATNLPGFLILTDWPFILFSSFSWGIWFLIAMDMWQRCAATGSSTKPRTPAWLSLVILLPFTAIAIAAGIYVRKTSGLFYDRPVSQEFLDLLIWKSGLSIFEIALVYVALVAAILSTVDTFLMVVAHSIFADIYLVKKGIDFKSLPQSEEAALLFKLRKLILTLPIICALGFSYAVYVGHGNVLAMNYISYSIPCAFFPLVVIALRKGSISDRGSIAAIIGGVIAVIAYCTPLAMAIGAGADITQSYNLLYGTPAVAAGVAAILYKTFSNRA